MNTVLDTRDMLCPIPVLKARKALKGMEPGALLDVLATDPKARQDVPAFCEATGHRLVSVEEVPDAAPTSDGDPVVRYRIEKAAPADG